MHAVGMHSYSIGKTSSSLSLSITEPVRADLEISTKIILNSHILKNYLKILLAYPHL